MRRQVKAARRPADSAAGAPARPSKGGHVYADLKEAILSGRLEPGSPIDKAALCDRLGMSRFPVTSAISRLAYERLVVIQPQHGSFVAKMVLADALEFMLIRSAIEGEVAARAAARQPDGLIAHLDRNLAEQRAALAAEDRDGFYQLDLGFHQTILDSMVLRQTAAVLETLRAHLERIRRILNAPAGRMRATFEEHGHVRDAIVAGDAAAAQAAMRGHLAETTAVFQDFAAKNPTLFSDRS